jgi:hypothetical protein
MCHTVIALSDDVVFLDPSPALKRSVRAHGQLHMRGQSRRSTSCAVVRSAQSNAQLCKPLCFAVRAHLAALHCISKTLVKSVAAAVFLQQKIGYTPVWVTWLPNLQWAQFDSLCAANSICMCTAVSLLELSR